MQNKLQITILMGLAITLSSMVNYDSKTNDASMEPNEISVFSETDIYIGFSSSAPSNTSSVNQTGLQTSPITTIERLIGINSNSLHANHISVVSYDVDVNSNLYLTGEGLTRGASKPNGGEFKVYVNTAGKEFIGIQQSVLKSAPIPYARITIRGTTNRIKEEFFLKNLVINNLAVSANNISQGIIGYKISMSYQAIKHVYYTYDNNGEISEVTETMYNYTLNTPTF